MDHGRHTPRRWRLEALKTSLPHLRQSRVGGDRKKTGCRRHGGSVVRDVRKSRTAESGVRPSMPPFRGLTPRQPIKRWPALPGRSWTMNSLFADLIPCLPDRRLAFPTRQRQSTPTDSDVVSRYHHHLSAQFPRKRQVRWVRHVNCACGRNAEVDPWWNGATGAGACAAPATTSAYAGTHPANVGGCYS